jgi:hypothetical protein
LKLISLNGKTESRQLDIKFISFDKNVGKIKKAVKYFLQENLIQAHITEDIIGKKEVHIQKNLKYFISVGKFYAILISEEMH